MAACASDPVVADELDALDLRSELADVYDRMGRVEEALDEVDVLVDRGYWCAPDPTWCGSGVKYKKCCAASVRR